MDECRVCENCGHQNDVSHLECVSCGADITIVAPTLVSARPAPDLPEEGPAEVPPPPEPDKPKDEPRPTMAMARIKLVGKNDQFEIKIPSIGCVLGRKGDVSPDYFEDKSIRVSRRHLTIFPRGDGYYVVDQKSLNKTYINKQELEKNKEYMLKAGDSLRMADMEFLVVED